MRNPPLIAAGVVLFVLGIAFFGLFLSGRAGDDREDVPAVGEMQPRRDTTSGVWPVAAGLCLAGGAACIGLGMNRWKQA